MATTSPLTQSLSYSGQATDEWSGGIAIFSNGDIATAFSVSKSNGASSVIVQRLSTNGAVVWSLDIGADYAPGAGSVLVGTDDKVYVTGGTKKGATGESGLNDSDIFVASISSTGQKLWYKNLGIGIHEIGSTAVLDANGNILLEGRVSEVNDAYSFIKDVPNFYGAEFSGGWRGFQLRINPADGSVSKSYTTGSGNSGGGPIAIDKTRNIAFVAGYTFGAVNGVNTVGNGDPNGANTYLIARNETTGVIMWTRMENWMRSNVVAQESENAVYFVDKGNLEKVNVSTGQTIWSKPLANVNYVLSPITGGGVLLSESESTGAPTGILTIRRFDSGGTETGSQAISHTGKLYPRSFIEQGDGTIRISGSTSGALINVPAGTLVPTGKEFGVDSFVLQINSAFSVPTKVISPVVRGNSLYTIVDGPSWTQAEANSVKLGGHLVTINNNDENDFVSTFGASGLTKKGDGSGGYWGRYIGLTDSKTEGKFEWISGEKVEYENWYQNGEPNSYTPGDGNGPPADYVEIFPIDGWGALNGKIFNGKWNDAYGYGENSTTGITETPFIRRGDSAYVIVQGPTWEEAEANAVKLGGHLVTINDAAENEWLIKTYNDANKGYSSNPADSDIYWTGLTKASGSWKWASGEPGSFTSWGPIEPWEDNGTNDRVQVILQSWSSDQSFWASSAGNWNNTPNSYQNYGLAEIKLAPNNAPTGTPTLTGTLKAGQVISIDKTPIQDADNFNGYTPTYNYSFEISNDNGDTWTKLTSTDATDNNTTYTLTTAEVGKKVRGVVSYLDGYGTNESVASAGSSVISAPVVRGNSLYSLVYKDHPRYENPWYGELGYATNTSLAWFSWSQVNKDNYRSALFNQAVELGGTLAILDSQNEFDFWKSKFNQAVSFSAYYRQPDGNIGIAYLNKESTPDYQSVPDYGPWSNGDLGSGYAPEFAISEIPLTSNIAFSFSSKEGAGVFTTSINLSAGTQTTGNLAEGAPVWWKVTGITADDLVSGALTGTGTITNGKLDIQHSLKVDSDTGEKFEVSVYSDADRTQQIGTTTSAAVLEAPVVRGNSLYTIVDGPSWTQAEANSVKLGGHLVTIGSKNENDYLVNAISPILPSSEFPGRVAFIGLNDKAAQGRYVLPDGTSANYFNWAVGEPNNGNGNIEEDVAVIHLDTVKYGVSGVWNDVPNAYSEISIGIAETPFIRRGDSAYVIVQGPTWEEAEANAVKLGGHLVTINDAAENEWIVNTFKNTGRSSLSQIAPNLVDNLTFSMWIGATDKKSEGQWVDAEGSSLTYTNWSISEPNNTGWYDANREDYAVISYLDPVYLANGRLNGTWGDLGSISQNADQAFTGIAEIKLAPNNTPTGTPTLSGTFKAGQVVTIGSTPIQDADNFTGYTPTFNYAFEVSNDNGTNWTKLTSTDATDNNSTYTLTTAEVGKKVRGVVSYLDGYGTNESVASAGSTNVLAPSNTAPTAVQTLTGSSKVGRVLTADKSTIVDPDGVPTSVSYGWEVSTNGTTWTKLTSADATDNNSTYALTAADLGKTIRSVISYTDGFGANEVARSAATTAVVTGNKPTSINLSSSSIVENVGANVAVAKLSSVDVDTDDAFKYSLVSGTGSTDNNKFTIAGDQLLITANPDYETKNSYSIRVRTTDLGGLFVDKSLVLKVTNVNEAPIAINLSDSDFLETIAAGSVIGNLTSRDPDGDTAFTYSLTPNTPRATFADNQFFLIVNDQLKINGSANFEQKDTYTVSVRSTDAGKLFYDQVFTLVVQDVDEAPTDVNLTGTGIDENAAVGSIVGTLVSTDQDESSTDFTYALVAGTKANNNDLFEIVGDQLKSKATFNFETKSSYVVNVRTTDEAGLTFDKSITIKVNNVNENPTDLTVSATAFNENVAIGTTVSTLGVLDPDKTGTYTYSLVSGVGDKDNQAFLIAGNTLKVNVATNFEIQKTYAVRLRVTDQGGLFFEKSVVLGVNNLVEKVSSGVSTTLAPDKDTLELTGTKSVFGMGNQFDNTITGNSGRNKLTGGMGKDILTGGTGTDTFFYNDLKESLLSGFDVITDFAAGERVILGFFGFEGDDLIASTGKATALNEGAIGSVLTNTTFLANNAAAFTVEGITGTFLALNDGRDGFQADSDALIQLSKYTIGSTTPVSII